jgi:protein gp37
MMADGTHIEWTEATWNPITGTNCYAMQLAGTRLAHHESRKGLTQDSKAGPVWTGEVRFNEQWLDQPLRWSKPRMIFVCAHGDLFHESVPDEWIDRIFAVMALCPQHTFQVLTKRSARMRDYFREAAGWRVRVAELLNDLKPSSHWNGNVYQGWQDLHGRPDGLPNVWLGVSVEDQQRADERIPDLLATPAAVRWISAEPLLGPVDLEEWMICPRARNGLLMDPSTGAYECCSHCDWTGLTFAIDWVVVGGESGSKARPMHPDWARSLRDQCAAASVPFFFKQWGEWGLCAGHPAETPGRFAMLSRDRFGWSHTSPVMLDHYPRQFTSLGSVVLERLGKKRAGRLLDGVEHNGMPHHA